MFHKSLSLFYYQNITTYKSLKIFCINSSTWKINSFPVNLLPVKTKVPLKTQAWRTRLTMFITNSMTSFRSSWVWKRLYSWRSTSTPSTFSYMVTISETMAKSPKNSWAFLTQFKILKEFNIDLHYMAERFWRFCVDLLIMFYCLKLLNKLE